MTAISSILAVVSDAETGRAPLEAACVVGRGFASHVDALHVRTSVFARADTATMFEAVRAAAEADLAERAAAAKAMFDTVCRERGVPLVATAAKYATMSAAWHSEDGPEEDVVARQGRLADLVVMGRPRHGHEPPNRLTLEVALRESARPLLLVPPAVAETIGASVAIAWNGSAEAARAVAASLPFLARADRIAVLSAPEGRHRGPAAADLATALSWRGLSVQCHAVAADGGIGEALLGEAERLKADLLVMGAYTHSRLRETVLGGVTRHVLGHAGLPVLMCH